MDRSKITEVTDQDLDQDLDHERILLGTALRDWQITQQQMFPLLGPPPPIDEERPEHTPLRLPSSFAANQRGLYNLTDAAQVELQLRRGDAFDILSDLRDTIHEYNSTVTKKRIQPGSQKISTCLQVQLAEIKSRMKGLMGRYILSFTALTSLGCSTQKEGLYPLDESQLWGKNVFLPHVIGDSSRENPWFWSVGKPAELSETSWLIERKLTQPLFKCY